MLSEIILFFITLAVLRFLWNWKEERRLPTGPVGFPILGNLPQMVVNPHLRLSKWAEKYGQLYMIKLGMQRTLVMSSVKVIKDIFGTTASTGKFKTETLFLATRGPYGIINSDGKAWSEQRRFCLQNLKSFGYGSRILEPLILSEVDRVVEWINERSGDAPIECKRLESSLRLTTQSTLWSLISGETLSFNDTGLNRLVEELVNAIQYSMKTGLGFYPSLKHVSRKWSGYEDLDKISEELHGFLENEFKKHKASFVSGQVRDLMDCYIEHLNNVKTPESNFYGELGYKNTISTLLEMFTAGGVTTSASITWAIIYLALHPEVQQKLFDELRSVLEENNEPKLEDKARMPYFEVVMLETFRYSSLAPQGLIHELLEDISYAEYYLPKGTILIPNLYHVHHDKSTWGDPQNFRPERFLEGNEQLKESVIPFSAGRRSCAGESYARDLIFLHLAKIIHKFEVATVPGITREQYLKPDVGIGLLPGPHKLFFKKRNLS